MDAPFRRDPRPAQLLARFHRRSRTRNPRLQVVAVLVLTPLLGVLARIRVRGREHIPAGAFIAAANHRSQLDALFVGLALRRRVHFMGKSDLFSGVRGALFNRLGGFPVRRGSWDADAFETAEAILARGKVMAMFPQGGIDPDGFVRTARPGVGFLAQRAGVPVLPIYLDGTRKLYKPWTWPKVKVTIGEPLRFPQAEAPSRESNQETADAILDQIKTLSS